MKKNSHDNCNHTHVNFVQPMHEINKIFKIGILLNIFFVLVEVYYGTVHQSLALVSDAVHNLTDVMGLVIAWLGYYFSKKFQAIKFSNYAALVNTSFLLITSIWVIYEAYERYYSNEQPIALTMIIVASIGCVINYSSAKLFHQHQHDDINLKSAYLHLMADAAISLGVVFAGVIIYFKQLYWVDPIVSILISLVIIWSTFKVFKVAIKNILNT